MLVPRTLAAFQLSCKHASCFEVGNSGHASCRHEPVAKQTGASGWKHASNQWNCTRASTAT